MLQEILSKKKATVKDLQRLCGYLNFICKAVVPSRSFMRRMYAKYSVIVNKDGTPKSSYEYKLKQHHHIHLDSEFKLNCRVWLKFLSGDLAHVVNRPMMDLAIEAKHIAFYSDASRSDKKGFGAVLGTDWI